MEKLIFRENIAVIYTVQHQIWLKRDYFLKGKVIKLYWSFYGVSKDYVGFRA